MYWNRPGLRAASRWLAAPILVLLSIARSAPGAETFPYRQEPVNYFSDDLADPVSQLRQKLDQGDIRLEFDAAQDKGYLPSLLKALDVNPASQMLVFAKNSVNARIISPRNPRALYFNDRVYVGYVPGAPYLEISAVDPRKGAVFYTLSQKSEMPPALVREESCLLCHASINSLSVPGHLVRSFVTDPEGTPVRGHSRITHETPYAQRWGGYYVTGDVGTLPHLGNLATAADVLEHERDRDGPGRTARLDRLVNAGKFMSSHSDVVALLVHEHQTHGHNLITRVHYEHLFQKSANSEEELLRYLLFIDEPPLVSPVLGSTAYESWFARQGPLDRRGRSLRHWDLETRLFKYRLSYLIYSEAFDNLPAPVRSRIYRRLWDVLSAEVPVPPFDRLPRAERAAILEIVFDTKPSLPEYWKP